MKPAAEHGGPCAAGASDHFAIITATIAGLPEEKFLAAIEVLDPLGDRPQVGQLMELARPRLRYLKPARALTLKRLVCQPFEDLLFSEQQQPAKAPGWIPRHEIEPVWRAVVRSNEVRLEALARELRALSHREPKRIFALAERLWRLAAAALTADGDDGRPRFSEGQRLIRSALEAALEIEAFKRAVPMTPILHLDARVARGILTELYLLRDRNKPIDAYLLVVMARLRMPAELPALLQAEGFAVPAAVSALLDRHIAESLSDASSALAEAPADLSPETVSTDALRLLNGAELALSSAPGKARALARDQRKTVARLVAKTVRERIIKPAREAIGEALAPDAESGTLVTAEAFARAMRRSRRSAGELGLEAETRAAAEAIRADLHRQLDQLFAEALATGPDDPAGRQAIRRSIYLTIRLIEQLEGSRAALPLLDRARRDA